MKKIYLLAISTVFSGTMLKAQTCANGRYATDVFSAVTTTSNITYGSNKAANGSTTTLTMDIYEPTGDTSSSRPLIVWAHGGSFVGGSKTDGDVVSLSKAFAKKGFVCVSINYRLGLTPFDSSGAVRAVLRAVQDMKASVRYFYKDKQTTNTYKIDTNTIFIGGSSAGALTALHMAYLNKSCEINAYINDSILTAMGGMDGYSGNQCYSSKVKGVINLCGALGKYAWIEAGDIPFCSMHGTNDGTVKYNRGFAAPMGIQLIQLDGSRMLSERANAIGVTNPFYTWYNQDHVPFSSSTVYMDSTINFVRDFLIATMGCTDAALLPPNPPRQTANLYTYPACNTNLTMSCSQVGFNELTKGSIAYRVFPNPANNELNIEFANASVQYKIELLDLTQKVLFTEVINRTSIYSLKRNNIASGMYLVKISNPENEVTTQRIVFE